MIPYYTNLIPICNKFNAKLFISNEITKYSILIIDNEDRGYVQLTFNESDNYIWVHNLYVRPDYRMLGVAANLLKCIDRIALSLSCKFLELSVLRTVWLIEMYERNNYIKHYTDSKYQYMIKIIS